MKRLFPIFIFCFVLAYCLNRFFSTDNYQYKHKDVVYETMYHLNKIDSRKIDINNGGCGLFAKYLSDYYDSTKVPYKIFYIYADTCRATPNHVVLQVDDITYLDSWGYGTKQYYQLFFGDTFIEVTKEKLIHDIYTLPWNDKFKRSDTTLIIKAFK